MCFKEQGVYAVHVTEGMDRFLSVLEELGIDAGKIQGRAYVWPRMTCVFGVDVNRKKVEYVSQPSICAAMVSSGVRMWSVDEFTKEVDCDVREEVLR